MALSIPLIFEEVAAANSFGARKKVLLENESNPLKDLLKYAFHPDIKFLNFESLYKTITGIGNLSPSLSAETISLIKSSI